MAGTTIGIKIADGSYYPVLEEGFTGTKRLTLTTVKDNQDRVQIDLYRGDGRSLESAQYIGSLVIENIAPAAQGEPEIELVIGIDEEGQLTAEAADRSTGEAQSFAVSLETLGEGETYDLPEFEIGTEPAESDLEAAAAEEGPSEDLGDVEALGDIEEAGEVEALRELEEAGGPQAEGSTPASGGFEEEPLTGETYPVGAADRRREYVHRPRRERGRGLSPGLTVLLVVLGLLLIVAIAWVVLSSLMGPDFLPLPFGRGVQVSEAPAAAEPAAQPAASTAQAALAPASTAAAPAPAAPAASPKPAATKAKGVTYRIKWGDTLWDIAATYYRNPWLYPRIARANGIRKPDLILAGTRIFIPEQ